MGQAYPDTYIEYRCDIRRDSVSKPSSDIPTLECSPGSWTLASHYHNCEPTDPFEFVAASRCTSYTTDSATGFSTANRTGTQNHLRTGFYAFAVPTSPIPIHSGFQHLTGQR